MKLETRNNQDDLISRDQIALNEPFPKRRLDLSTRSTEGETLILDREGGVIHQLNPTASLIWELCDGQTGVEEIVSQFVEVFEVDGSIARDDVNRTLVNLFSRNLLEKSCK